MASLLKSRRLPLSTAANLTVRAQRHDSIHIRENIVIQNNLGRAVLVVALCAELAMPARADLKSQVNNDIVAGVVVAAAIVVVAAIVIVHYSKKRTVTGCVSAGPNGMTVTDEKDRQTYALSGNTVGITPGDRMRLHGKKIKSKGPNKTLVWEAGSVARDFGICHP
jgi:hypothetical protein